MSAPTLIDITPDAAMKLIDEATWISSRDFDELEIVKRDGGRVRLWWSPDGIPKVIDLL